ncbi:TetR/AcrR family transcriptional regulator [Saccharopolyspora tripterygii]
MDPALPDLIARDENSKTLLERAFSDAVESVDDNDGATARVLDAAYEQFCRMGIRRSTMEDVAKRAGVSRITVYRRFANKDTLVEHVVRREFRRYFDQFLLDIGEARTLAERLELGFASSLRTIRRNPLIGGLMDAEPDVVVPSMISDGGRTMTTVSRFLAERLRIEQRAGHVSKDVDVALVAEMMVRVSTSFLLTPSDLVDLDDEQQIRHIARRFLLPMLDPSSTSG